MAKLSLGLRILPEAKLVPTGTELGGPCESRHQSNSSVVMAKISAQAAEQPTAATGHATTKSLVSYPVGFSDLDITKMTGAKILYLRIRYAAETLCQSAATWGKKEGETCVRQSIDDAVLRVNSPLLTQYYQLRRKGDKAALVQFAKAN